MQSCLLIVQLELHWQFHVTESERTGPIVEASPFAFRWMRGRRLVEQARATTMAFDVDHDGQSGKSDRLGSWCRKLRLRRSDFSQHPVHSLASLIQLLVGAIGMGQFDVCVELEEILGALEIRVVGVLRWRAGSAAFGSCADEGRRGFGVLGSVRMFCVDLCTLTLEGIRRLRAAET